MGRGSYRQVIPLLLAFGAAESAPAADAPPPASPGFTYHETKILGTSLDLEVCAAAKSDADTAHTAIMTEIERLRKILSTYDAGTDLGKVNATRDPVKVSKEVIDVLKLYDQWQGKTKGAFSGRLGSVIAAWKDAAKTGKMPDKSALAALVEREKTPLWKIDDAAGTVQRLSDQLINIDSLGKGFIVSRAAVVGKASPGVRGLLLNIGGDITAVGTSSKTGIEEWRVGIADPAHPAENAPPLVTVKLAGLSIATSGSYERGYDIAGKRYSHIINPKTGYPIDYEEGLSSPKIPLISSATVIAKDNAAANALATALCVMSSEEGMQLTSATPGAEALLILSDGKQMRSNGFSRYETVSAQLAGKGWPSGFQVSMTFQQNTNIRERPYMAFWVEDSKGQHVVTLGEWGNNGRWVNSLTNWFRFARNDQRISAVSRATRQAGKYTLVWDGKDQAGNVMPAGQYKICIEAAYERNGHSFSSTTIMCGDKAATATMNGTQHFDGVQVAFASKGN